MKSDNNFLKVHFLLQGARVPVPVSRMCEALECSPPTVHRIIAEMRNSHDAPIHYHRKYPPGYLYSDSAFELPMGVWFSQEQVLALLAVHQLLKSFQPGLLDPLVGPLQEKYLAMVDSQGLTDIMGKRIRLLRTAARDPGPCFNTVATALVQRKRLNIDYDARSTGQASNRDISPQRLIHYRDNWFLDAWCHKQNELRIFSIDCIRQARQLKTAADEIADEVLDGKLGGSYGIFAGEPTAIARLLFTPFRARWVSREQWHPQQQGRFLDTGEYVLEIPYHRSEELINEILRQGPDVQVLEPISLREEVVARLRATLERYP